MSPERMTRKSGGSKDRRVHNCKLPNLPSLPDLLVADHSVVGLSQFSLWQPPQRNVDTLADHRIRDLQSTWFYQNQYQSDCSYLHGEAAFRMDSRHAKAASRQFVSALPSWMIHMVHVHFGRH